MNITYEKNGDYLIPNLISDPEPEGELRKFGLMRRHYLKEHRSSIYQTMLLSGKLKGHLFMMQEQAETQFDLFSDNLSEDFIRRMVFSGTSFSVVMKDAPMIEIEEGLRKAKQHLQYMCTRAVWLLQHKEDKKDKLVSPLTVTEREILKLMALGKTTKEIAAERFLSVYTVMTHRKNIFRKLEVNNVHEATKYALRAGIVDVVEYYI